ncbi:hypothetical protein N665_0172s0048 [Sinapis alba]|nr:hypothetical protein N665_0172s0048 [Sinapis alba]
MAGRVSKKTYSAFIIVNLLTILFSARVSDSIEIKASSEKATPAKCYTPCKIMCDPKKDGRDIANPHIYHNPIERFCINFNWIFGTCKD